MFLILEKESNRYNKKTDNEALLTLFHFLKESWFFKELKDIEDDIAKGIERFIMPMTILTVLDDNKFKISYNLDESDTDTEFIISKDLLWDAITKYKNCGSSNFGWKKMAINFDGKKFDIKVEN